MHRITFREANSSDSDPIGRLHVEVWRETYAGLLPDAFLAGLSEDSRSRMWKSILGKPTPFDGTRVFVAECEEKIVGFSACSGQRDGTLFAQGFGGEFGAIYVLRSHQREGLGRMFMGLMARDLMNRGRGAASLWVLRENTAARAFYERLEGRLIGGRLEDISGTARSEVAYGWRDLALLTCKWPEGPTCPQLLCRP